MPVENPHVREPDAGSSARGSMADIKLRAEGISKSYGPLTALGSVSMTVKKGEFLSLLGPSGSGKTTFLMTVAGLILPDRGQLWINDRLTTYLPVQDRDIGMVFQNYALFPHLSVFENIAFPLRMRRRPEAEIRTAVGAALEKVHLSHAADRLPRALSGGQQQRIALARCLVYEPSIILMDEPLGALDRNLREQMQIEIRRLHRSLGTTLLYVTHDQDEAMTMSDRICLMRDGDIEQLGSPEDLYFRPTTAFSAAFLGDSHFLDAVMVSRDGDRSMLRLSTGETVTAPTSQAAAGSALRLMVRPERMRLGAAPMEAGWNELDGTVIDTVLTAGLTRVYLQLADGTPITVAALAGTIDRLPEPGATQRVCWPVGSTLMFPREGRS